MHDQFEDAWNALTDAQRSLLLEQRHIRPVPEPVAGVLVALGLSLEPQPGLFPAPAHWPPGFVDFLDDKAAITDEDPDCE
ncbi:hypothetical protein [Actinoplanes sp. TFC3]|uniref:hypothetical protein n=1 Tax=Actinoplanes sp. TFC3 TaxID=1710355 RepID=UPI000836EE84|nr:hypothetical protein [Actinoplanes sp. TFC3]